MPVLGLCFVATFFLSTRTNGISRHIPVLLLCILGRLGFDAVALPMKSEVSSGAVRRSFAYDIHAITEGEPIAVISKDPIRKFTQIPFRFYDTVTYLEMLREGLVLKKPEIDGPGYYIANVKDIGDLKPLYTFEITDAELALVKK